MAIIRKNKYDVPGFYGIIKNEILAVTAFSLSIFSIVNGFMYQFYTGEYQDYSFYQSEPFLITTNISTLVMFLFYYLDTNLTSSFWSFSYNYYDLLKIEPYESEKRYKNDFIAYKLNSHSSIFQFFIGVYALILSNNNDNLYVASKLFGAAHIAMGIFSYIWWASSLYYANLLDNLYMELIVNSVTVLNLSAAFPSFQILFVLSAIAFLYKRGHFIRRKNKLVPLGTLLVLSSFVPVLVYNNCADYYSFMLASAFSLGGLIPKIACGKSFIYGTTLFHFMEAAGFIMFYKWAHTFPLE